MLANAGRFFGLNRYNWVYFWGMIVITGAAGFIGSCLAAGLREAGYSDLVLVDDFTRTDKLANHVQKAGLRVDRQAFFSWLDQEHRSVQYIFHLGARTDTTEFDRALLFNLNFEYSQTLWQRCVAYGLPLVYASSAATYGDGHFGFEDNESALEQLKPLNPYGESKHAFDLWVQKQPQKPYQWVGLKFFNVYGPNEFHKGRMASVVFHTFHQIKQSGQMQLFRSHHPDFKDGEQLRDFIYVKDVVKVCLWLMTNRHVSGLFNLGTGKARTFFDLSRSVFAALEEKVDISFIDTPADIRDKYQYFTEANMHKLRQAGYAEPFTELEVGIQDYVSNYLKFNNYY